MFRFIGRRDAPPKSASRTAANGSRSRRTLWGANPPVQHNVDLLFQRLLRAFATVTDCGRRDARSAHPTPDGDSCLKWAAVVYTFTVNTN